MLSKEEVNIPSSHTHTHAHIYVNHRLRLEMLEKPRFRVLPMLLVIRVSQKLCEKWVYKNRPQVLRLTLMWYLGTQRMVWRQKTAVSR
jgi:hypothetical protein